MAGIRIEKNDTVLSGINHTMDVTKKHLLSLDIGYQRNFVGKLCQLWMDIELLSGSPTAITMRLCSDSAGNKMIVTDTISAISYGLTNTSLGTVVYNIDIDVIIDAEQLYLFLKTDHGTIDLEESRLSFQVFN